jgi:hypothetical protein
VVSAVASSPDVASALSCVEPSSPEEAALELPPLDPPEENPPPLDEPPEASSPKPFEAELAPFAHPAATTTNSTPARRVPKA